MDSDQIIERFLEFFRERGHSRIDGSSLVPEPGDPVLFTTSGMHQLTPYLLGRPHPQGRRLVGLQRCLRTTDLDEVGDRTHLTVFQRAISESCTVLPIGLDQDCWSAGVVCA